MSAPAQPPRSGPAPRRTLRALCVACALALLAPASAGADVFSAPSLLSFGTVAGSGFLQQVEYAHDSAISGDGRYVVFDGSVGGLTGVWRRDLSSSTIEQVAGGEAAMPSISRDGRYVSFTTNEGASLPEITHLRPDSSPHREAANVYRRDMDNQPAADAADEAARAPGERAFLATSVASGAEDPLRYSGAGESRGSLAATRTAMSGDGNEIAFVTSAVSDLVAYPALEEEERAGGEDPAPHTPAGQVAVHRFDTGVTELVSRCRFGCGQGAAAGAAEPVVFTEVESHPVGAATLSGSEFPPRERSGSWPGASISADGSTVAWLGESLASQTPMLPLEAIEPSYQEPLWRRLPAQATETRRVTGGSDPEAPGCAAGGEGALRIGQGSASDPCQGPFLREASVPGLDGGLIKHGAGLTPRLSGDGEEVVFGANARLLSEGNDFDRELEGNPTDLFVVNMAGGLTRAQALTPLTQAGPTEAQSAEVTDLEISPDGRQVAFSTIRTSFSLGWPTLISVPAPEVAIGELYDADLANGTLTRVTHGYEGEGEQSQQPHRVVTQGGDPYADQRFELGAATPGFSATGDQLVFTSTAANLVYGDGNSPPVPVSCCRPGDGSDAFAVTRTAFASELVPQSISPAPSIAIGGSWRLRATAQARRDGSVVVYARVPAAGSLGVVARGAVAVRQRRGAHRARARRLVRTTAVARRRATEKASSGGLLQAVVRLRHAYAPLARRRSGLPAVLTVTFASSGRATLNKTVSVTFRRTWRVGHAGRHVAHRSRRRR